MKFLITNFVLLVLFVIPSTNLFADTNDLDITIKFTEDRDMNSVLDNLQDPDGSGYSFLRSAEVVFECYDSPTLYKSTTSTNDSGYASATIVTPNEPGYCGVKVSLEDANEANYRWIVTDDSSSDADYATATPMTDPSYSIGGYHVWSFPTKIYGSSDEHQDRANVFDTADNFYHNVILNSDVLDNRWGKNLNLLTNPSSGGNGPVDIRVDSSYTASCGKVYVSGEIRIKASCINNDRHSHEMGHFSMYVSFRNDDMYNTPVFKPDGSGLYTFPERAGGPYEWGTVSFSEGWAVFLATVARWPYDALAPVYRQSTWPIEQQDDGECWDTDVNEPLAFRHRRNVSSYFWDLYDDHTDTSDYNLVDPLDSDYSDDDNVTLDTIIDILDSFPYGSTTRYEDNGCDEHEDETSEGSNKDQPNPRDFKTLLSNELSTQDEIDWAQDMYYMNCMRVWENDATGSYKWGATGHSYECADDSDCKLVDSCDDQADGDNDPTYLCE